jgi:hypothetical protein
MTYVLSPLLYALYKMTSNMVHVLLVFKNNYTILHLSGARVSFYIYVLFYTYQVHMLNLISLGATTFLRVKDSLK